MKFNMTSWSQAHGSERSRWKFCLFPTTIKTKEITEKDGIRKIYEIYWLQWVYVTEVYLMGGWYIVDYGDAQKYVKENK